MELEYSGINLLELRTWIDKMKKHHSEGNEIKFYSLTENIDLNIDDMDDDFELCKETINVILERNYFGQSIKQYNEIYYLKNRNQYRIIGLNEINETEKERIKLNGYSTNYLTDIELEKLYEKLILCHNKKNILLGKEFFCMICKSIASAFSNYSSNPKESVRKNILTKLYDYAIEEKLEKISSR